LAVVGLLPFIVIGITTGAVYGLAGVGLVLTYKTSGIFNFAYGAVAALAVFVFYWLHTEHGMPWPYAAALCLFVLSPREGLVLDTDDRTIRRWLTDRLSEEAMPSRKSSPIRRAPSCALGAW